MLLHANYHKVCLKDILLSSAGEAQKHKYCMILPFETHRSVRHIETESRDLVVVGWEKARKESYYFTGYGFSFAR